jgi:hypothetical protein
MALSVVDTPGVGSVYQHNTVTAETAMRTMDVAVSVLTMDPPISAAEYDLLSKVRGLVAAAIDICQLGRFYDRSPTTPPPSRTESSTRSPATPGMPTPHDPGRPERTRAPTAGTAPQRE